METIKPKHIWHNNDNWAEELNCLREIIAQTELKETTKWGGPVFVLNNKNVLGIDGFKNYFTIWFYNGVFLNDPKKVLVNAQEGVTKALRQWRFNSKKEIIGCVPFGIILCLFSYYTNSIWPAFFIHATLSLAHELTVFNNTKVKTQKS